MLPEERVTLLEQGLAEARKAISPRYDDVFREVQQRISDTDGGKVDIESTYSAYSSGYEHKGRGGT